MATQQQDLRELREELEELRGIVAREAKRANGRLNETKEELRVVAHNAGATIRDLAGKGRDSAVNAYESYESTVQKHPVSSTALAFFGGFVAAALFNRRW